MVDLLRKSGVLPLIGTLVPISILIVGLDLSLWSDGFRESLFIELNSLVAGTFVASIALAVYAYRQREKESVRHLQRELMLVRTWNEPEGIRRKSVLLNELALLNAKPAKLVEINLEGASLNGIDLSEVDMSRSNLRNSLLVFAKLRHTNLLCSDFSDALLVRADLTGASLYEADFSGALLSHAVLDGADLELADLRGVRELTPHQLVAARNWEKAFRDADLACGAPIPKRRKKSLGQQFRERVRGSGDPMYPYRLMTIYEGDTCTTDAELVNDEAE